MPIPQLSRASSKYGAQMGRPDRIDTVRDVPVTLHMQCLRIEDGDYDQGGAYWGFGQGSEPVFRAVSDDGGIELFRRAKTRDAAIAMVLEDYPLATFYPREKQPKEPEEPGDPIYLSSGETYLMMTLAQAESAAHQGQCDADVNRLMCDDYIATQLDGIEPDAIRKHLKEYGAWDEAELADDAANR